MIALARAIHDWREKRELIKACKLRGGHWWVPTGMVDWKCRACPAETDGPDPKDGS